MKGIDFHKHSIPNIPETLSTDFPIVSLSWADPNLVQNLIRLRGHIDKIWMKNPAELTANPLKAATFKNFKAILSTMRDTGDRRLGEYLSLCQTSDHSSDETSEVSSSPDWQEYEWNS